MFLSMELSPCRGCTLAEPPEHHQVSNAATAGTSAETRHRRGTAPGQALGRSLVPPVLVFSVAQLRLSHGFLPSSCTFPSPPVMLSLCRPHAEDFSVDSSFSQ